MREITIFDVAAEWAILTDRQRRSNPKSVLDVAPDGFVVPWSEVKARFPEMLENTNVVDARITFQEAFDRARKRVK